MRIEHNNRDGLKVLIQRLGTDGSEESPKEKEPGDGNWRPAIPVPRARVVFICIRRAPRAAVWGIVVQRLPRARVLRGTLQRLPRERLRAVGLRATSTCR